MAAGLFFVSASLPASSALQTVKADRVPARGAARAANFDKSSGRERRLVAVMRPLGGDGTPHSSQGMRTSTTMMMKSGAAMPAA